ncbi:MAG: maleate cis-trans isomerase family protein [Aeromicrobium sp.]
MSHPPSLIARPDETLVGVIVPFDMALDAETWRWVPDGVSLLFTRTPFAPMLVTVAMAETVSDEAAIAQCTRDLLTAGPAAYAYACTSGSFIHGIEGERRLVETMQSTGGARAVTTSGALLAALTRLGVRRVATATPYDTHVTERLTTFLKEADVEVVSSAHLGLSKEIWTVPYEQTLQLVRDADSTEAEAIFVSCTNLATYDVIAPLEAELGKPVLTANQVTMWGVLESIGRRAVGPHQWLLHGPGSREGS